MFLNFLTETQFFVYLRLKYGIFVTSKANEKTCFSDSEYFMVIAPLQ